MTTLELIQYYANLLIIQYLGLDTPYATIEATVKPVIMAQQSEQLITFTEVPTSGSWSLSWGGHNSSTLNYNSTSTNVQAAINTIPGLEHATVTGNFSDGFTVEFVGVSGVADLLAVNTNTLVDGSDDVVITITETDQTLPIAVQNAFDPATAVGVQLDVVGKYQNVVRSGVDLSGNPVTLDDVNFRTLIQFAILRNTAGSSLADIQNLFQAFFPNQVYVFDYANMHMSYLISSSVGSQDLVQLLVSEGLLPKPMGVQLASVIYVPVVEGFFGFRTYINENDFCVPFNTYTDYNEDWPWLTYNDAVQVLNEMLTESGDAIVQENGGFLYLN